MTTYSISTNSTVGYVTLADKDEWVVALGVSVTVDDDNAFFGVKSFTGNRLKIFGSVETTGEFTTCLMKANATWVVVNYDGSVKSAATAIEMFGLSSTLVNRGTIEANYFGVIMSGTSSDFINEGTITSVNTAVNFRAPKIDSLNTGTISGLVGVSIAASSGSFEFDNQGTISGTKYAFVGGSSKDTLTNTGTINGDIFLRNGNDTFILDGGTVNGIVGGGNGNDTYYIDRTDLYISELNGGGTDLVVIDQSYTLGAFLDNLTLTGTDAVNGTGNKIANVILGNDADNILNGLGGRDKLTGNLGNDQLNGGNSRDFLYGGGDNDILSGGAGNDKLRGNTGDDRLTGDAGKDVFIFKDGDGIDVITDFKTTGKLHDIIDLRGVTAITGFRDLMNNHFVDKASKSIIDYDGNKIVLQHVHADDLSSGDFLF